MYITYFDTNLFMFFIPSFQFGYVADYFVLIKSEENLAICFLIPGSSKKKLPFFLDIFRQGIRDKKEIVTDAEQIVLRNVAIFTWLYHLGEEENCNIIIAQQGMSNFSWHCMSFM